MSLWLKCNNDRKSTYTTTYQTSTTTTSSRSVQASTTSSQTLYTTIETQNFWNSVAYISHTVSFDACPISPEGVCTMGNMTHSGKIVKYTTTYDDYSVTIGGDITAVLTAGYHTVTDTNHNYTTTTKTFSTTFPNNNSSTTFSYTANMSTTCTGFLQDYSSSLNRSRSYGVTLKYSVNRKAKTSYWSTNTLTITTGNAYNSGTRLWYPNFDYQAPSHTYSNTVDVYNYGTNKYSSSGYGHADFNVWRYYTISDPIVSKTYKSWWTTTSASTLTQRINVYTTKTTTENVNKKISTYTSTTSSRSTTCSSMYNLTLNTSTYSYTSSYLYLEMTGTSYWDPISISGSSVTYGSRSVSVLMSIYNTSLPSNESLSYGSNATWSARFSYQSLNSGTSLTTAWWWWGVYNSYVSLNSTNKTFTNYYIYYSGTNTCSNPDYFKQNCSLRAVDQSLSMSYSFTHTEAAKISNLNSTVTLTTGNSTNSGTTSYVDQLYSNSILYSSSHHGQFYWLTSKLTTMFTNFSMTLSSTWDGWWQRTFTITNTYSAIEVTTSQGTSMDTGTFQTTVTSIR